MIKRPLGAFAALVATTIALSLPTGTGHAHEPPSIPHADATAAKAANPNWDWHWMFSYRNAAISGCRIASSGGWETHIRIKNNSRSDRKGFAVPGSKYGTSWNSVEHSAWINGPGVTQEFVSTWVLSSDGKYSDDYWLVRIKTRSSTSAWKKVPLLNIGRC